MARVRQRLGKHLAALRDLLLPLVAGVSALLLLLAAAAPPQDANTATPTVTPQAAATVASEA